MSRRKLPQAGRPEAVDPAPLFGPYRPPWCRVVGQFRETRHVSLRPGELTGPQPALKVNVYQLGE